MGSFETPVFGALNAIEWVNRLT